jgi:hypothetical protein
MKLQVIDPWKSDSLMSRMRQEEKPEPISMIRFGSRNRIIE